MKVNYKSPQFQASVKQSLEELIFSNPKILEAALASVVEDLAMAKAIKSSKKSGLANKREVEIFLNENRV